MRKILIAAASAALGMASVAVAQDAAPPGCKWIGDGVLACKDGKGYWRRSGDDQIVGTYPLAKPKPKPAPAPAASSAPTGAAPVAPVATASVAPPLEPPPIAAPPEATMDAALPPVPAAETVAAPSVEPAVVEAAPEAPKPWWRRWLDSVWRDIQAFLRLFGVGR